LNKDEEGKETEVPQVEVKTPTAEEELVTLKTQLSGLETELTQTKKGLSTAHATLTQRDTELKRRADLESQIGEIRDTVELLATAMATGMPREDAEDMSKESRGDVLKQLTQQRIQQEAKRKQEEYARNADAIHARAQVVFAEDEDALDKIEDLLMSGVPQRVARAEAKVAKAEQGLTTVPKKEDNRQKDIEEAARKMLEAEGALKTNAGGPTGGGGKTYSRAEIDKMDWRQYKQEFPNPSDFMKALGEGRVTE